MSNKENLHTDHRKRMKARFLETGLDKFNDHEKLEFLLYYALPRMDTNPLGHELLNTFGSISAVFDASVEDLCKVKGVSEHTSILIKMIPQLARAYMCDLERERKTLSSFCEAGEYFSARFIGSSTEEFYVVFLDNSMRIIDCVNMSKGDINSTQVSMRKLISKAISTNASCVMMAHNHPGGVAIPSNNDLNVTNSCRMALEMVGVKLVEHFVIAGENYVGIMNLRSSVDGNSSLS